MAGTPLAAVTWLLVPIGSCVVATMFSVIIMLLPNKLIAGVKPLKMLKSKLLKVSKRLAFLCTQGPFWKLSVWSGRKCGCGYLSSRPSAPTALKAKPQSSGEALLYWAPKMPAWNPFHEETYICCWKVQSSSNGTDCKWHTKACALGDYEDSGKRMKMAIEGLPENQCVCFRVAAVNRRGRSEWSAETVMQTLARPNEGGGFWGPLGPACKDFPEGQNRYRWQQAKGAVEVKIRIPDDWKASDIRMSKTPLKLELTYHGAGKGPEVVLAGSLTKRVKIDEVFWQLDESKEDGRHIAVAMTKEDPLIQWPTVFEGSEHPAIDTKYVRLLQDGMTENIDWLKENAHITRRNE